MLMKPDRTCLLLIDLQEKLVPAIADRDRVIANVTTLMTAAGRLRVPVTVTEHCAEQIGPTVAELRALVAEEAIVPKVYFSGVEEQAFSARLESLGRKGLIVAGTETHVCVLQTTLDLQAAGYQTFLVADATGTRHAVDRESAIQRMRDRGVEIVTTEMVLFEWLERGATPEFQAMLPLIKKTNSP